MNDDNIVYLQLIGNSERLSVLQIWLSDIITLKSQQTSDFLFFSIGL